MADKVRLSALRAQYPMYQAVPDEQFLLGLRRQLYPNVPLQQFTDAIDFDTGPKATDGMSGGEKFLAGVGKAFVDLGRGAGQWVGAVSREDAAEARKRDQALMDTGAGMAGNIVGNVAALAPTIAIPGAASIPGAAMIGAASGALSPSESTGETVRNIGLGGAVGAGANLAGRAIGSAYQGAKALAAPLSAKGREMIAARTLQRFADDPLQAAQALDNPQVFVPGSMPTVGELTQDAGLAQLQRSVANMDPQSVARFSQRAQEQAGARAGVLRNLAGTADDRAAAAALRDANAAAAYGRAFDAGIDPAALTPQATARVQALMQRPSIRSAVDQARSLAAEEGVQFADDVAGSVRGLHFVKKALDDQISGVGPGGIGPTRQRALMGTRDELLGLIDDLSPDYAAARAGYAADSAPINRMDVGNRLYETLRPALSDYGGVTRESGAAFAKALRDADLTAARATGFKGSKLAELLTPDQMGALEGVAKDLARKANANELGRAAGSNTAQNLISQNLLEQIAGPSGLPRGWLDNVLLETTLGRGANWALRSAEPRIQQILTDALLDPAQANALLRMALTPNLTQRAGSAALPFAAPAAVGYSQGGQ